MKKTLLSIIAILAFTINIIAATVNCKTTIKDVTVYKHGAMVNRSGSFSVQPGHTTLQITGLTTEYSPTSVQVGFSDMDIIVYSIDHKTEFVNKDTKRDSIKLLEKEIANLQDSLSIMKNMPNALQEEKNMILANKDIKGNDKTLSVEELRTMSNFFRERLTEIDQKLFECETQKKVLSKEISIRMQQINNIMIKNEIPYNTIVVELESKKATTSKVDLTYFVSDASWIPTYNTRVHDVDKPVVIESRAKVSQNSKEDWKNVKLHLSTEDPFISNYKPALSTYKLPIDRNNNETDKNVPFDSYTQTRKIKGIVREKSEPLPFAVVMIEGTSKETTTDYDGNYEIAVETGQTLVFSFVGYEEKKIKINQYSPSILNVTLDAQKYDDNVVVAYGVSKKSNNIKNRIGKRKLYSEESKVLEEKTSGIKVANKEELIIPQASFSNYNADIELPATIPSDEKEHEVAIKEEKINCNYIYSAIPKLSERVYLMSEIPNWSSHQYQDGKMAVYMKNVYLGDSKLKAEEITDTMRISLGADRDIKINRTEVKSLESKQFIGTNRMVEKTWKITLQNRKNIAVEVNVDDRYPIATNEDIKVELTDNGGAEVNKENGSLKWKVILKPGEKKELKFTYKVKYPKSMGYLVVE
ncbi:MAG: mucoidy inhibitor MuiA family protein [Paludibacteraceae bacterium]|nr:mucoidy inhibitor MuiA family protein [Paludibacteraceae bacterium]